MKDYIKFYKYDADYQAAKPNLPEPHAVYCWETNIVDISNPIWNEKQYFALKAVDGDATLTITNTGGAAPQLWYSYDQENWTDWTALGYPEVTIYDGKKVYLKGDNDQLGYSGSKYSTFGGTGYYAASGSISSLFDGDDIYGNLERVNKTYMFYKLFYQNTALTSWEVDIPYRWTSLLNYCFQYCFQSCTSLTTSNFTIPEGVTSIGQYCLQDCFQSCTSLTTSNLTIPEGVTSLGNYCFKSCFQSCTSLTTSNFTIPESVTRIGSYCLQDCFNSCGSLTTATLIIPESVTRIESFCFNSCFNSCVSLTTATLIIPEGVTFSQYSCFSSCFQNCKSLTNLVFEHHPPYSTSSNCYIEWFRDTPNRASNIFRIYQEDEAAWPRTPDGIPTNFTIEYLD